MNWLLNLSTRAKLFLGFGLMLAFLGIVRTLLDELDRLRQEYRDGRENDVIPLIYQGKAEQASKLASRFQGVRK